MVNISRLLNSVGKKAFVNYYYDFKYLSDKKTLAEKLLRENPKATSLGGQLTRIYCAARIFENKLQLEALNIIINSKLDDTIIEKAIKLKTMEE